MQGQIVSLLISAKIFRQTDWMLFNKYSNKDTLRTSKAKTCHCDMLVTRLSVLKYLPDKRHKQQTIKVNYQPSYTSWQKKKKMFYELFSHNLSLFKLVYKVTDRNYCNG